MPPLFIRHRAGEAAGGRDRNLFLVGLVGSSKGTPPPSLNVNGVTRLTFLVQFFDLLSNPLPDDPFDGPDTGRIEKSSSRDPDLAQKVIQKKHF